MAVRERGQGRNHIHTIQIYSEGPKDWKIDPNQGEAIPYKTELIAPKKLWKYGFSTPKPVRFDINDRWTKEGLTWPTDKKGIPKQTTLPIQMAFYMAKYITKELSTKRKDNTKWRTKLLGRTKGLENRPKPGRGNTIQNGTVIFC